MEAKRLDQCLSELEQVQNKYLQVNKDLVKRNEYIASILDNMPLGLVVYSIEDGIMRYMNPGLISVSGWTKEVFADLDGFYKYLFPNEAIRERARVKAQENIMEGESPVTLCKNMTITTMDGEQKAITIISIPLISQELMIMTIQDVTDYKRTADLFKHWATHDSLTDLPNRTIFHDRLSHAIVNARRNNEQVAVMFLDLDNFKTINNEFGHKHGDLLIRLVAERFRKCLRESDTVARVGGDEFSILVCGISEAEDAIRVAEKILQAISVPFHVEENEIYITISIGICLFPQHCDSAHGLIQNSDMAMYAAKEAGKNNYQLFTEELAAKALDRLVLSNQLRHALERSELMVYYQPQINSDTGELLGVEALLRWNHPEYGVVTPPRFLPVAEETGLIVPIGEWVMYNACAQNKAWQEAGFPKFRMAVNLSDRQIRQPDFVQAVKRILAETRLDPALLELEFTENIVFQSTEQTLGLLKELKGLGVQLAIDDFGTGYTSLSYLTRFPFDTIKLDLSFAKKVTTYPTDAAIVAGVIAIAKSLKMSTIVEGVETIEQLQFFQEHGCNKIQGWYYSPALPANSFENLYVSEYKNKTQ